MATAKQERMMQRQLDKLEKDTYKVRKAEGRAEHGQTSYTIMGIGTITWFCLVVAIVMPEWRCQWIGILGYPHTRSWGLFQVVGKDTISHHQFSTDMCRYMSLLAPGGVCLTPVCRWYRIKCTVSREMYVINYSAAFFLVVCLILHTLCLIWTARCTPRMIRWAAAWWAIQFILHGATLAFWIIMSSASFQTLDTQSLYPEPALSTCFFTECVVIFGVFLNCILGRTLMYIWPESSSSEDDSDDDELDSDYDEFGPMFAKGKGGKKGGKGKGGKGKPDEMMMMKGGKMQDQQMMMKGGQMQQQMMVDARGGGGMQGGGMQGGGMMVTEQYVMQSGGGMPPPPPSGMSNATAMSANPYGGQYEDNSNTAAAVAIRKSEEMPAPPPFVDPHAQDPGGGGYGADSGYGYGADGGSGAAGYS